MQRSSNDWLWLVLIGLFLWWLATKGGVVEPVAPKATAATFIYEKDLHVVPGPVFAALNKLNREQNIVATVYEEDTKDGTGDVPEQYKSALEEARKAGLPALVVMAGTKVVKIVVNPKTEAEVLDAIR